MIRNTRDWQLYCIFGRTSSRGLHHTRTRMVSSSLDGLPFLISPPKVKIMVDDEFNFENRTSSRFDKDTR